MATVLLKVHEDCDELIVDKDLLTESAGDATYLRLDCANDPLTATLETRSINPSTSQVYNIGVASSAGSPAGLTFQEVNAFQHRSISLYGGGATYNLLNNGTGFQSAYFAALFGSTGTLRSSNTGAANLQLTNMVGSGLSGTAGVEQTGAASIVALSGAAVTGTSKFDVKQTGGSNITMVNGLAGYFSNGTCYVNNYGDASLCLAYINNASAAAAEVKSGTQNFGGIVAGMSSGAGSLLYGNARGSITAGFAAQGTIQAPNNASGSLVMGSSVVDGLIEATAVGAHAHGLAVLAGSTISAAASASTIGGYVDSAGTITANGVASAIFGTAEIGAAITASGDGSLVFGTTTGASGILSTGASSNGGMAAGNARYGGLITATGDGSFAHGYATGTGTTVTASGRGSLAQGGGNNSGDITASGYGSIAGGYTGGTTSGYILSSNSGSIAMGSVYRTGNIRATRAGATSLGGVYNGGVITATREGAMARGYAYASGSLITATAVGALAQGYASGTGGSIGITASGTGSIASGFTYSYGITASGLGSMALGNDNTAAISATATNTMQLGPGVNAAALSLQIGQTGAAGTGIHFHGLGAPGGPVNGDFWVAAGLATARSDGEDVPIVNGAFHGIFTTSQNVGGANGTITFIDWDGTEIQKDNNFTHSTVTNPSRIQVDATGRYEIKWIVGATQTGGARTTLMSSIRINGITTTLRGRQRNYSRGASWGDISVGMVTELDLTNGDYIECAITVDDTDGVYTINSIAAESEVIVRRIQ